MQIAIIEDNQVKALGEYKDLFPETSFSTLGPNTQFMDENGCLPVSVWRPYDHDTEELIGCEPYIEDGQVFTVRVQAKPQPAEE